MHRQWNREDCRDTHNSAAVEHEDTLFTVSTVPFQTSSRPTVKSSGVQTLVLRLIHTRVEVLLCESLQQSVGLRVSDS